VGDDLADAGLGDFEFFGEAAGGEEFDEGEAVDFEIAGRRGKRGEGERGRVGEGESGHGKLLGKRTKNRRIEEPKVGVLGEECTKGCGLVWSFSVKRKKDFSK
jgi:hypothetical protein